VRVLDDKTLLIPDRPGNQRLTMKDAAAIAAPVEVVEGVIKEDEEQRLY
jgi:hypothetical protein